MKKNLTCFNTLKQKIQNTEFRFLSFGEILSAVPVSFLSEELAAFEGPTHKF